MEPMQIEIDPYQWDIAQQLMDIILLHWVLQQLLVEVNLLQWVMDLRLFENIQLRCEQALLLMDMFL